MSRRASRFPVALLLALTLVLTTPSAFAAPARDNNPDFGSRIVRLVKKIVRNLTPVASEGTGGDTGGVTYPGPPKP